MVEQYKSVFKSSKHVCVYNIVDDLHSRARIEERVEDDWFKSNDIPMISAAGMLEPWKGFGDLILAIKEVSRTRKVRLSIFGDGSLRNELQNKIDELELNSTVKLFGYVENPLKFFKASEVFVLSSYVEGLPNVLVEAMMCGCSPVATDCPTGPYEVLQGGKFGYLVPVGDPLTMAKGIHTALESPLSSVELLKAIQDFSENRVIQRHFEILGIVG
jgi:glycosyltransferase involved in cell wall biosynthesis